MNDDPSKDVRPIPDPTRLTNELVFRELNAVRETIKSLRELMESKLDGHCAQAETKFASIARDISMLQREIDTRPLAIQAAIDRLRELHDMRFSEHDIRDKQSSEDAKLALDAALRSSKEAFNEQKTGTTKQIDQIVTLISASNDSLNSKISALGDSLRISIEDVKSRLTLLEGAGKGSKDLSAMMFTLVGLLIAGIAAVIAFIKMT